MLELSSEVIVGLDLAGKPTNPTGFAIWEDATVETGLICTDEEILQCIIQNRPVLTAIDAPFNLPKTGLLRKADKEMIKHGYHVFPPRLSAMKKLTIRAKRLNKFIATREYKTIEVHPTSTRKALNMPTKDWKEIQSIFTYLGLTGDFNVRVLTPHEIDAITASLTAHLYLKGQAAMFGDPKEGHIIVPKKQDWRTFRL